MRFGLKAVIAGSFAEIFHGNCTTLGIPCVVMDDKNRFELSKLVTVDPSLDIIIDIEQLQIICGNQVFPITMKESVREAFLDATYDPLDTLLASGDKVNAVAKKLGYL